MVWVQDTEVHGIIKMFFSYLTGTTNYPAKKIRAFSGLYINDASPQQIPHLSIYHFQHSISGNIFYISHENSHSNYKNAQ